MKGLESSINSKQIDSYSMLIISKYFNSKEDYINVICVNSKFKETTEKLRYNPIPTKSLKLFPNIQTQYLYNEDDIKINGIDLYKVLYDIECYAYLNIQRNNEEYCNIKFSQQSIHQGGYIIPDYVKKIVPKCFFGCGIKTMRMPSLITSIPDNCFEDCYYLTDIELPKNLLTLGNHCFMNCKRLRSINIPSIVQSFGSNCFSCCYDLSVINIPNSLTYIGSYCFYQCRSIQSIVIPTTINVLEAYTFYNCKSLTSIELPTSLNIIKENCFYLCEIESIEIPTTIKSIGLNCFLANKSLTHFKLQSNEKEFKFKTTYNDLIFYQKYGINCSNIVLTQESVYSIMYLPQEQKMNSDKLIIPNGIVEIMDFTFYKIFIKSIVIPTTVTSIGNDCFSCCSGLKTLLIPTTIISIGINNFYGCDKLNNVSLPLNNNKYPFKVSYGDYLVLKKCGIDCSNVMFDDKDYSEYSKIMFNTIPLIYYDKTNQTTINFNIQTNIISLKSRYLSKHNIYIDVPLNVSYLCNECFKDYSKLQLINIPTTVKYIGKHLIDGCTSLTQFNYDGDWNNIVVSYTDHLRFKTIGLLFNSIEYTNDDKIKYGTIIPSIIHSLHHSYYDRSDKTIYIPPSITSLDKYMFSSTSNTINSHLKSIIIPTSIQTIPKYCFSHCSLLTKVLLPLTLTSIKKKAFEECISLSSIIIPTSVISIEQYAFNDCYSLTTIQLSKFLITFGNKCFKGCHKLRLKPNSTT
ncbi:hypothetical protein QTN25_004604 [Entamoeba marina]